MADHELTTSEQADRDQREKDNISRRHRYATNPEFRAKEIARSEAKRSTPGYKERQAQLFAERCARDPEHKAKLAEKRRIRYATDPEVRARSSASGKARYADPEKSAKLAELNRLRRADPIHKAKEAQRKRAKHYGLTLEQYERMLQECNGRCPICKVPFNPAIRNLWPNVDHCHRTGRVRGILCRK
jgi:hypothetical protein